jgi:PhnB protein
MQAKTTFAPQLIIPNGITNVDFYVQAFGAVELRRISNSDDSIHVSELSVDSAIFHLHEETADTGFFCPKRHNCTTVTIGLFVSNVDTVMNRAIAAGGDVISPVQNYEYGYRQGKIRDPFGHISMIEAKI